jgi:hypothetical protein
VANPAHSKLRFPHVIKALQSIARDTDVLLLQEARGRLRLH